MPSRERQDQSRRFGVGSLAQSGQTVGDLRAILGKPVPPDAVSFDGEGMELEAIRAEEEYAGVRATIPAKLGTARLSLQIDMGVGDAVTPPSVLSVYPTLLDFPAPSGTAGGTYRTDSRLLGKPDASRSDKGFLQEDGS